MSEVTETVPESVGWGVLTWFLAWLFFGVYSVGGVGAPTFLATNIALLVLLSIVVAIQFILDITDQHRKYNILAMALVFGVVGAAFAVMAWVTFTVVFVGVFFYAMASLIAEAIVEYAVRK